MVPKGTDKAIGTVISFTYPNKAGWVGFFIMEAEFRGRGLGAKLFKAALESFKQSKVEYIGLDGVEEQVPTYGRRGFVTTGRINLYTHEPASLEEGSTTPALEDGVEVVDIRHVDARALGDLDLAHTGLARHVLWTDALFDRPDAYGFAVISSTTKEVKGLVLVRDCEHGRRVGPLLAADSDQATVLLHRAMTDATPFTGSWIAEVFGPNEASSRPFLALGWKYINVDYHRMWVEGKQPPQQAPGGQGTKGMFAIFDASEG